MAPHVCFLIDSCPSTRHDNASRIPRAFQDAGWQITCTTHEAVTLEPRGIGFVRNGNWTDFCHFDLIWMLGLGPRISFLDRMQMLACLPRNKFVNSPEALLQLHGKYHAAVGALASHQPETHASCDPHVLEAVIRSQPEVKWVIKPPAGSFGEGIYSTHSEDPELPSLLSRATGENQSRYTLIQHYLPQIIHGEKRILVANGHMIGSYLRQPGAEGKANIQAGGQPRLCTLTAEESGLTKEVMTYLTARNCRFAAIDLCFPYLMEVNLANPGGLATLESLSGENPAGKIPSAFCSLSQLAG